MIYIYICSYIQYWLFLCEIFYETIRIRIRSYYYNYNIGITDCSDYMIIRIIIPRIRGCKSFPRVSSGTIGAIE